jgi:hypothetical protein
MDGNDVSTVAIKSTRNVERFLIYVGHEQYLGNGLIVRGRSTTSPVATTYFISMCRLAAAAPFFGNVGSPDAFFEGNAGPVAVPHGRW